MLKKIRVALAAIFFVGITLLFLDITGVLHLYLGWMAKIQFLPAVLALNFAVVAALALVTLLFGRVYCSVICPLGIMQDISSHLSGMRKGKKMRFRPKKENKWLRYGMLGVFIIALIAGIHALVALLAPYSTYGRIVQNLFQPLYILCNNLFASIAERAGSYAFYDKEVWIKSLPTFIIAVVMFLLIIFLSWKDGRTWCNSICPVGTTLSFLSRFAMFRPIIDTEKCKDCHACERKCKASCIDIESHKIDYSRCVDCFNCIDNCKFDALHYQYAWGKSSTKKDNESKPESRRAFIATTVAMTAGASLAKAQEKVDGGYAEIIDKKKPKRQTPIVPPGAQRVQRGNHAAQHAVLVPDVLFLQARNPVSPGLPADNCVVIVVRRVEIPEGRVLRPPDNRLLDCRAGCKVHIRHPHGNCVKPFLRPRRRAGFSDRVPSGGVLSPPVRHRIKIVFHLDLSRSVFGFIMAYLPPGDKQK